MLSPLETGTTRGRPRERGRNWETGPSRGTWPRRVARGVGTARQLQADAARPGKAPVSHTCRGLVFYAKVRVMQRTRCGCWPLTCTDRSRRPKRPALTSRFCLTLLVLLCPAGTPYQHSTGTGTACRRPPQCARAMLGGHGRVRPRSSNGCAAIDGRQQDRWPVFLCTRMWITCAKRQQACARAVEMLGIPPAGRAH